MIAGTETTPTLNAATTPTPTRHLHRDERRVGRRSLGEPLRAPFSSPADLSADEHFDLEDLLVLRPASRRHPVARRGAPCGLHPLLERALRIERPQPLRLGHRLGDHDPDERTRAVEPVRREHRRHEGLHGVGDHVRLLALEPRLRSAPQREARAEPLLPPPERERLGVHERAPHPSEDPFVGVGMRVGEELAHAEAKDRVAQELEALVVGDVGFVREAGVGECLLEARDFARADDLGEACRAGARGPSSRRSSFVIRARANRWSRPARGRAR